MSIEDRTVNFTFGVTNAPVKTVFWLIEGDGVDATQFDTPIQGTMQLDGEAYLAVIVKESANFLTNFKLSIMEGGPSGPLVLSSELVTITRDNPNAVTLFLDNFNGTLTQFNYSGTQPFNYVDVYEVNKTPDYGDKWRVSTARGYQGTYTIGLEIGEGFMNFKQETAVFFFNETLPHVTLSELIAINKKVSYEFTFYVPDTINPINRIETFLNIHLGHAFSGDDFNFPLPYLNFNVSKGRIQVFPRQDGEYFDNGESTVTDNKDYFDKLVKIKITFNEAVEPVIRVNDVVLMNAFFAPLIIDSFGITITKYAVDQILIDKVHVFIEDK